MNPQLSIVIVNYNTFKLTTESIRSVYQFVKNITFEVILVDNASSDRPAVDFKLEFPDIHLICNDQNLGFAKANNEGMKVSKGEFILLLNSDAALVERNIGVLIDKLRIDERIGIVSCKTTYPNGRIQNVCNRFPSIKYELIELLRLQKLNPSGKWLLGPFFSHETSCYPDWVWGSFMLFRKSTISKFPDGRLHDDHFMYYEDVLWCYFMKKRLGLEIYYDPGFRIIHHKSASSSRGNFEKNKMLHSKEYDFLHNTHRSIYVRIYYLIKAIKLLTIRVEHRKELAKMYFRSATESA